MIMEVEAVSPFTTNSQDTPRETWIYRRPKNPKVAFGTMLAEEEEKLTLPEETMMETKAQDPMESHYAMTEQELEESLRKLLRYAGLDGLE